MLSLAAKTSTDCHRMFSHTIILEDAGLCMLPEKDCSSLGRRLLICTNWPDTTIVFPSLFLSCIDADALASLPQTGFVFLLLAFLPSFSLFSGLWLNPSVHSLDWDKLRPCRLQYSDVFTVITSNLRRRDTAELLKDSPKGYNNKVNLIPLLQIRLLLSSKNCKLVIVTTSIISIRLVNKENTNDFRHLCALSRRF